MSFPMNAPKLLDIGEAEFQQRSELKRHLAWESFIALAKKPRRVLIVDRTLQRREMKQARPSREEERSRERPGEDHAEAVRTGGSAVACFSAASSSLSSPQPLTTSSMSMTSISSSLLSSPSSSIAMVVAGTAAAAGL